MSKKNTVIVVAYPDRGEGNDPEPFFFFFFFFFRGVGSLSQPRLNIFTVGNMRVMICLDQGGLRSLSASSIQNSLQLHLFIICWNIRLIAIKAWSFFSIDNMITWSHIHLHSLFLSSSKYPQELGLTTYDPFLSLYQVVKMTASQGHKREAYWSWSGGHGFEPQSSQICRAYTYYFNVVHEPTKF